MVRPIAAALAVFLLAGCGGGEGPTAEVTRAAERSKPVTDELPPESDVRPGASLDRILADRTDDGAFLSALREPRVRLIEPVANRYVAGQVDSVVTLVYDGLAIEAYAVTGGRTFVRRLAVIDGAYGTDNGLSVGEAREDLESVLGRPVAVAGDVARYEVVDAIEDPTRTRVEITYEPDLDGVERASQIVWLLPLD